ncbi:unnamed protein product [Rhizophagus irregularis]|nr:unnamed protein product [Rhizophagus irregularis]CAB5374819.1 unnamed protein product [Rhizophagus irregularis]
MEISKKNSKENLKDLWKGFNIEHQEHVITNSTIDSTTELIEEAARKVVYMNDLEKRKQVYGICGECNEPGTGRNWCRPCNAKRGGFGKIYSAEWPEGFIEYWDIENQKWYRYSNIKVALKSLDNSSCLSTEFLNEIKSHLQIYLIDIIQCYGITQDPNTKDYMMVLEYCGDGNLRNYYLNNKSDYYSKIEPVNSGAIQSTLFSEGFDCQLDESDLNEMNQDDENNIE